MLHNYSLCIAGLNVRIASPAPLQLPEYFLPFVTEETSTAPDIAIELFSGTDSIRPVGEQPAPGVFCTESGIVQRYHWKENQYIVRLEPVGRDLPCRLGIPEAFFAEYCRSGNWLASLALERLLLPHGRLILHASAVVWQGKAYLFIAPSGGGKSTQAALWEQAGARILNGDKVILARGEDGWTAYGGPVAGSSRIYRSDAAPVAAIMLLRKSPENRLSPVSKREGFLSLYSSAIKSNWDEAFNSALLDSIEQLSKEIPICRLDCTPTREAVDCVRRDLKGFEL